MTWLVSRPRPWSPPTYRSGSATATDERAAPRPRTALATGAYCEWVSTGWPGQVLSGRRPGQAARSCSGARGGRRCSSGLPTGGGGWLSWRKKKPGCAITASSAPSRSCSRSSTRASALGSRRWSRWGSAWTRSGSRSRRSSARASTRRPGTSRPRPGQEGARAFLVRVGAARPRLHRHRAHPARPHPSGRRRGRQVLVKLGADLNRVRQQVIQLISGQQPQPGC
jgi:hypothetical protein